MIRCAFCDSAMMALEINGTNAHVCPLCGAVFARRHGNTYSLIADLKGAQGVKELLHSMRPARSPVSVNHHSVGLESLAQMVELLGMDWLYHLGQGRPEG